MAVTKNLVNIGDANITGNLEASSIVKRGGTSSLFLKADGSVDSNTYSTTDTKNTAGIDSCLSDTIYLIGTKTSPTYNTDSTARTYACPICVNNGSIILSGNILSNLDLGSNIGDNNGHAFNEIHAATLHLANDGDHGGNYGGKIRFGDGNLCYIQETSDDDVMTIYSSMGIQLNTSGEAVSSNSDVSVTGSITASNRMNATNGFYQTSDIRKKNIKEELSLDKAYDLIDKCQTIIYTLKDDKSNKEQIGLIAQEVREFFPELVEENTDGVLSLDYARLTVIVLRVLKDLINRISKLENNK